MFHTCNSLASALFCITSLTICIPPAQADTRILNTSDGAALVDGSAPDASSLNADQLIVGQTGSGMLFIDNGGQVTTGQTTLAEQPGSSAFVFVGNNTPAANNPAVSTLTASGDLSIGLYGSGMLQVATDRETGGASVQCNRLFIAAGTGASGLVLVSGPQSQLTITSAAFIGGQEGQDNLLDISDGDRSLRFHARAALALTGGGAFSTGNLQNRSGGAIALFPDSTLHVQGDFIQSPDASLIIAASDGTPAPLNVTAGHVSLRGRLQVSLPSSGTAAQWPVIQFADAQPDIHFDRIITDRQLPGRMYTVFQRDGVAALTSVGQRPIFHADFTQSPSLTTCLPDFTFHQDPTYGTLSLIDDPLIPNRRVLQMRDDGADGNRTLSIGRTMDLPPVLSVAFDYRFLSDDAQLQILIGNTVLDTLAASGHDTYLSYQATFDLAWLNLTGQRDLQLLLSGDVQPEIRLDGLTIGAPVPEPAGLAFLLTAMLLLRRRHCL